MLEMTMDAHPFGSDAIDRAIDALLGAHDRLVLAVSGGIDSMVLLHAAAKARTDRHQLVVATFDHGTGPPATRATALVTEVSKRMGLTATSSHASLAGAGEAVWRAARWRFLTNLAAEHGARVVTAHTADDQLETVVMRALRGAGARGLAGLYAQSAVARPLIETCRASIERYARENDVRFIEDPSNASLAHLRNRVRHQLLPAIQRVRPRFGDEMLQVARHAAAWRADVDSLIDGMVETTFEGNVLRVARARLTPYDSEELCVLWPALAARAKVTLDRRGTARVCEFTKRGEHGARIQLAGGFEVIRDRDELVVRRSADAEMSERPLTGLVQFGGWRFVPGGAAQLSSAWEAELPADRALAVRAWRHGDRMPLGVSGARRVKRFFADARIVGAERIGWPVVLVDGEIVWIPGVRRSDAAAVRSGRPVVRYHCERFDG
jgi:tRNA(Ile)-lysidine synthase